jgi:nitrogenase subunit NifH
VVNLKHNRADLAPIARFAKAIGTQVLGVLPRDPLVCEAELYRQCIVDYSPDSPVAVGISEVVERVLALDAASVTPPKPLPDTDVRRIMRGFELHSPPPPAPPLDARKSTITEWSQI